MPDALIVVSEEGFWGEELLEPLEGLDEAGVDVEIATPGGRFPLVDDRSKDPDEVGALMAQRIEELEDDPRLQEPTPLHEVDGRDFEAVVFPGGHGTEWDVNQDADARRVLREAVEGEFGKALVVCHAVGLLGFAKATDGTYIAEGREVTGFPNAWEDEIVDENECMPDGRKLPYRVEDEVKDVGAKWDAQLSQDTSVEVDGDLVTARGPSSSGEAIDTLLDELGYQRADEDEEG
jgi:putative intracellular protease/amidase